MPSQPMVRIPDFRARALACAGITLVLLGGCAPPGSAAPAIAAPSRLEMLDVEPLSIETGTGQRHEFRVYVARTSTEKREGLMFVEALAPHGGMLFPYRPARVVSMWMKNTPLSLDMLFVQPDGTIESIAVQTEPISEQHYVSGAPVSGVIELVGGTAEALGIGPGDRVIHPWFAQP